MEQNHNASINILLKSNKLKHPVRKIPIVQRATAYYNYGTVYHLMMLVNCIYQT